MTPAADSVRTQPLAAPGCWRWQVHVGDADALACAQPDWRLEYQQLSAGPFSGRLQHVQLPGLRLVREDSDRALRQRGDLGGGGYGFAMPLASSGPAIFDGQPVGPDAIMVGRSDALDLCTPTRFSMIAAVVDAELLQRLWERLHGRPPSDWLGGPVVVAAQPAAAEALRALHLQALAVLCAPDSPLREATALVQLRDALLIEWIAALPRQVDASALPTLAARKRLVDRACALMLAQPDEPLSMLEVCRRVGASRRKLNYCFQDVLGSSPVRYLRAVRLNGVRRELRAGGGAVQDVAVRWGFWHPGQFSADYKRQFGELPSATLRAARVGCGG